MSLIIYPFVKGNGPSNMGTDFYLFSNSELKDPIFRNYGWNRNEITFGYGQNWDWVKKQSQTNNFPCTRRPTGGGIVNHSNDWTYSLIIPNSDNYKEQLITYFAYQPSPMVLNPFSCIKKD